MNDVGDSRRSEDSAAAQGYGDCMDDTEVKWIVRQRDVLPPVFLMDDGTWGSPAGARRFDTEEEALLTPTPEGTSGFPRKMTYHPHRTM